MIFRNVRARICYQLALRPAGRAAGLLLLSLGGPPAVTAQGRGQIDIPRLPSPVRVDGLPTDSAWTAVAPLPLTMFAPTFRGTVTQRSEIRIAYDDDYLYAAGWFYDSRPEQIRINSLYRDRWSGDDTFALMIDPFNDNETGLWFYANPAGVRMDASITADARSFNDSWNGVWDVATRVTGEGWFAEMRIPFATLGFQERDGRVVMGLTVTRLIARSNERVTFPAIDPRYEFRQPSVMQDVVLRGVTPHRPVYITPYVLSGMNQSTGLPPGTTAYRTDRDFVREAGADFKYGPSDNFHLDASINTDFAQVEADDQQVNLTRFPLFFPEKRQFFQEQAGVFDFDLGSGGRLFHSRQIGLAPDRTPIRMLGGGRVVARSGAWDLAALDVQTDGRGTVPGENLAAARVKRRVMDQTSYVGGMVTSRLNTGGDYNVATGVDGYFRMFGNDYLTLKGVGTFDDANRAAGLAGRSQLYAQWQRRSSRGFNYFAQYNRAGASYLPELGFLQRTNFSRLSLFSEYFLLPKSSPITRHGPGAITNFWFGNGNGQLETYYLAYWWNYAFRSGAAGWLEVIHNYERVPAAFSLGNEVSVLAGVHKFTEVWFNFSPPAGRRLRAGLDTRVGGFYDGWRIQATLTPTWNVSRNLELGGSYQVNRIRFPDRATGLDTHIARVRVGIAGSARLSATTLVQWNSVDQRMGANIRLRYNFGEGSDLWIVYNEGLNTDRVPTPGMPRLPLSDSRSLQLKLTRQLSR